MYRNGYNHHGIHSRTATFRLHIKPENVLINLSTSSTPTLKLIDFGESVRKNQSIVLPPSNLEFAAPEMVLGQPLNEYTDSWSFGVLLYVFLSGVSPFLDDSIEETTANILKCDFSFPGEYFSDILESSSRATMSERQQSSWFIQPRFQMIMNGPIEKCPDYEDEQRMDLTGVRFVQTSDDNITVTGKFSIKQNIDAPITMAHGFLSYIRYWENWVQWAIILGVFLCAIPSAMTSSDITTVPVWQHHVAAIVIFLVWLELMMLAGRFPIFGLYVQMFTKVAVNFAKFLLAYCCLLIAFGLSFGVIFSNYPAFQNVPWTLLKTVTMMAGELEFEDIFYNGPTIQHPVTAHAMFFTFVLLVTVILTNLLVGLAVSDIQGLQASAGLDRLTRQAELVARLEGLFFSRLLRRAPSSIILLCQRSALLRTSRYHLQFCVRPNDPRDTRLPKDIVVNIYKLVAERRDRNQSIKRKRREQNLSFFTRSFNDSIKGVKLRNHSK